MDFKDLIPHVADAAPLLGGLLGGPAGATVGAWLAKAFGSASSKPEDVLAALKADSEAAFKLAELQTNKALEIERLQNAVVLQELTTQLQTIQAVNATMQSEAHSEDSWQRRWRPFIGFIFGGSFAVVTAFVCYLMYLAIFGKDHDAMRSIPDLVDTFTMLFGIPGAILGVSAWGRNRLKVARVEAQTTPKEGP